MMVPRLRKALLLLGFTHFVAETLVGAGQGGVGIDAVVVGPVDEVEEEGAHALFGWLRTF